jgi:hypothetical protein
VGHDFIPKPHVISLLTVLSHGEEIKDLCLILGVEQKIEI